MPMSTNQITRMHWQDGDSLGSLNKFKKGDDPQQNAYLKNPDRFTEVESDLTFVGICGIKVRRDVIHVAP